MSFKKKASAFFSDIFAAAVAAVDPGDAVKRALDIQGDSLAMDQERINLSAKEKIWVVGFGKAAATMAQGVEEVLGDRITGGVVVTKYGHSQPLSRIQVLEAGHPVPDAQGLAATARIMSVLAGARAQDLVICLISGGGSALLIQPEDGITLETKQHITQLLLKQGAPIEELNAVRKAISQVKSGKLAALAKPARLISLIVSDVIGDPIDTIASGPTAPSLVTRADAVDVLKARGIWTDLSEEVRDRLEAGDAMQPPRDLDHVTNRIIASNAQALQAAQTYAENRGYRTLFLSSSIQGEAREIAKFYGALARETQVSHRPLTPPACFIAGGETTVHVRGKGQGGRNTEMALALVSEIHDQGLVGFLSAGSDGTDGDTDAAGAMAFSDSLERARKLGLDAGDFLRENDSYNFFKGLGDLFVTGPTGTNVMDIQVLIVE